MSLDLRARAAVAEIELLLAFNPHQRRGPDGRWIKMPDSELKRPRRPARGGVENPLYRRRREQFNNEVLAAARAQRAYAAPETVAEVDEIEAMPQGRDRDARVNALAEELNRGARIASEFFVPPTEGGPRQAARRAETATRPALDAPYRQRRAALARSVRGGAVDERTLAQGQMGETRRFELADGTSAVYKKATRDWDRGHTRPVWTKREQLDAEGLSSWVAAALGVPAPAVHRASEDEIYMEFMPGVDPEVRWPGWREPPPRARTTPEAVRFGLLDVLIENTDRHAGNFLVNGDDEPVAIDHGMAFSNTYRLDARGQRELSDDARNQAIGPYTLDHFLSFVNEYKPNPLTQSDVQKVRTRLARTRREFERLGHLDWYDAMVRRLDRVAANASGDVDIF